MDPLSKLNWTFGRRRIESHFRRECGLTRDQARAVVHALFGSRTGKMGILQEAVAVGFRVHLEGLLSIEAKKRRAGFKQMPDGRIIIVPERMEPKVTLSRRFKKCCDRWAHL